MPGKKGEKIVDENGNVTYTGGLKAAQTNKTRYGENYYAALGALGGRKGREDGVIKGFARMTPEQRSEAGRKGGKNGRRGAKISDDVKKELCKDIANGMTLKDASIKYGVSLYTVRNALDALDDEGQDS